MNILITGCNGQLGNEMQLLEKDCTQHNFFNTDVDELDITDAGAVDMFVNDNNIDIIVNCAAYTAVDKAESNGELCRQLNAVAPENLARAVDRRGGMLIHISTDYVFDGTAHRPYTETDKTCPDSVYGTTKLEGEQRVTAACRRAVIIRTAWLYSRFGNNFVKTIMRLARDLKNLGVVFDQIGTPTCAADLAYIIMKIIDRADDFGQSTVFHFSDEGTASWYDFALDIIRLAGIGECRVSPVHTDEYPTPARRPAYSVLDKTKIKKTLNIAIPHWHDSLAQCIEKMKSHE